MSNIVVLSGVSHSGFHVFTSNFEPEDIPEDFVYFLSDHRARLTKLLDRGLLQCVWSDGDDSVKVIVISEDAGDKPFDVETLPMSAPNLRLVH